jgi:alanine dehydrogenase
MREVIAAVEEVFRVWGRGEAKMPSKSYLMLEKGDFRAMPAYIPGAAGMKWVNVHPQNPSLGLPTVMAVLIYSDPETGYPLAVMDAADITAYRTGAAAAVASRYLANKNARTLGLVGAGKQAYTQIMAHAAVFELELIKVYDILASNVTRLINTFPLYRIQACSLEETVASDIVCTVTPAREPVVKKSMVRPGTHINAVGADAPGKEELEADILTQAMIVVDDMKQATASGEVNVPLSQGLLEAKDIYGTLGEIICGQKRGRRNDAEITLFDSTGVAIEDMACAHIIYQKARQKENLLRLNLVDG